MQSASCIQVFTFVHPLLRLGWIVVRTLILPWPSVQSDHLKGRTPHMALRFSHGIGLGLRHCATDTQLHTNHSVLFSRSITLTHAIRQAQLGR